MSSIMTNLILLVGLFMISLLVGYFFVSGINSSQKYTKQLSTGISLGSTFPADVIRQQYNEDPGNFLGTGQIPEIILDMSLTEVEMLFHGNMISTSYKCKSTKRFGNKGDGGYDMCIDEHFEPVRDNCLVYSFGIRNEWSFDDDINNFYGCEVHSFDPSMGEEDHLHKEPNMFYHNLGIWGSNLKNTKNWELRDLATIVKMLKHENRTIDYLKVDVEGAEWPLITHLFQSHVNTQVKQMALELHTPRLNVDQQAMSLIDYAEIYNGFIQLQKVGFQKFLYHANNGCCGRFTELTPASVAKKKLCCYETFYVNSNYIH